MDVTKQLLALFLVEKQLRGLQARLGSADRFLKEQTSQLSQLDAKIAAAEAQFKQIQVLAGDAEGEMARLDARMGTLREQMNAAQTNKEYKAFLTEVNTLKAERDRHEQTALEQMTKADAFKAQLADLRAQREEREKLRVVAQNERTTREGEIAGRLSELKSERATAAQDIPKPALSMLERLLETRGEEAMAPIDVQDKKRHEFTCGSCQMSLPVETFSGLLNNGKLTTCVSCGCILYIDEEVAKSMTPAASKR